MRRVDWKVFSAALSAVLVVVLATHPACRQQPVAGPFIIPDPQFVSLQERDILVPNRAAAVVIVPSTAPTFKENLAQEIILNRLQELGAAPGIATVAQHPDQVPEEAQATIFLVNYDERPSVPPLDAADRHVLEDSRNLEQNYVIRTQDNAVFLVGSGDQGLLYAATTLIQLIDRREEEIRITTGHIRDFPSFKYRVASDWLLNNEINRWAYDYGDGREKYLARAKRKLDFCLLYKINAVRFEGFGWAIDRTPGYNSLIKELAKYARQRGIHLFHGGYGAGYALGTYQFFGGTREGASPSYQGRIFFNRKFYPDGATYGCVGHPFEDQQYFGKMPANFTRSLGTCRSNDTLNRLKAEELTAYVRELEPGGLYIHNEDVDNYRDTAPEWKNHRCDSCRKKWPNDDLKAPDGGAGALAHGFNALLDAVFSVRNEETGYDAKRDCFVGLISPGYVTYGTGESELYSIKTVPEAHRDWNDLLALWTNVGKLLKFQAPEVQIGFREIWPLEETRERWVPALQSRFDRHGLKIGTYFLVFQGADFTYNDYPFVTSPLTNVMFEGATTIENSSGSFAQEPMQLLNAAYGWNTRAYGVFVPATTHGESRENYMRGTFNLDEPPEIVGDNGFLAQACGKIYGEQAGGFMYSYNRLYGVQDEFATEKSRVNETTPHWANRRIYPIHTIAYSFARASRTWRPDLAEADQRLVSMGVAAAGETTEMTGAVLHEKLSRVWSLRGAVTRDGSELVQNALRSEDLRPEAKEDLEHLFARLNLGFRFADSVSALHLAYRDCATENDDAAQDTLQRARDRLAETVTYMNDNFEFRMSDASGGDQSSWRYYATLIGEKIDELQGSLTAESALPVDRS